MTKEQQYFDYQNYCLFVVRCALGSQRQGFGMCRLKREARLALQRLHYWRTGQELVLRMPRVFREVKEKGVGGCSTCGIISRQQNETYALCDGCLAYFRTQDFTEEKLLFLFPVQLKLPFGDLL